MNLSNAPASPPSELPEWLKLVREKMEGLRFGVIQLVVHDGRVTQIELTEKVRLPAVPASRVAP